MFTKVTFSLDVFFDFSEDVPNGMLCFEGPTPDLVVSDPRPNHGFVQTRATFFSKTAVSSRREASVKCFLGRGRAPTPGPRNLNENPSPEELSGTGKIETKYQN